MMINLAEKIIKLISEKRTTEQLTFQKKKKKFNIHLCRLFGINRQIYYRSTKRSKASKKNRDKVMELVENIRMKMPKSGKENYTLC